jgi:exodeoxyribonuclease-1
MPIAKHPKNGNGFITVDLSHDVDSLLNDTPGEIKQKLYAPAEQFTSRQERPGIKVIHANRSPFITTAKAMSEDNAERLGLDRERCLDNYRKIAANPEIAQKLVALYDIEEEHDEQDIDHGQKT